MIHNVIRRLPSGLIKLCLPEGITRHSIFFNAEHQFLSSRNSSSGGLDLEDLFRFQVKIDGLRNKFDIDRIRPLLQAGLRIRQGKPGGVFPEELAAVVMRSYVGMAKDEKLGFYNLLCQDFDVSGIITFSHSSFFGVAASIIIAIKLAMFGLPLSEKHFGHCWA